MTDTPRAKPDAERRRRWRVDPRLATAVALIVAFAAGAGATSLLHRGRAVSFVALAPAPITSMRTWGAVAIKGQVAEVFGNKFVVQDDSGRALVETGPKGDGAGLVGVAEVVTVQGRFENGSVHAVAVQHADGRTNLVGPPGRHHPGPMAALGFGGR